MIYKIKLFRLCNILICYPKKKAYLFIVAHKKKEIGDIGSVDYFFFCFAGKFIYGVKKHHHSLQQYVKI